ncbi:hypothetical protein [Marinobacter sp. SS8-8]|uniref:hypothetical protein n=1 Tax=Marinobacter sp. SS8-8 TaxID=3050452 RepID=UPI0026DFE59B|nr:hypothetical protein [Marinobacter sp. SS8-8]
MGWPDEDCLVPACAGMALGAVLVIYYSGTIRHYPSGLTASDTLFFVWVIVVFGFYYSIIAFVFFLATIFWVGIAAKPVNWLLEKTRRKNVLYLPLVKEDRLFTLGGGAIANIAIFTIAIWTGHPLVNIVGTLLIIGLVYALLDELSRKPKDDGIVVDPSGRPFSRQPIPGSVIKFVLVAGIYLAPIYFAQAGGGITRTTFETMGVRQIKVGLFLEQKEYGAALSSLREDGYIEGLACDGLCEIKEADILFTGIGNNTKVRVSGEAGSATVVIPNTSILMIVKR